MSGNLSHGRGGAGNINPTQTSLDAADLKTPTIKTNVYTSGRGGNGNMVVKNDKDGEQLARKLQDVEGTVPKALDNPYHVGRGGAANISEAAKEDRGLKNKGFDILEKIGLKK